MHILFYHSTVPIEIVKPITKTSLVFASPADFLLECITTGLLTDLWWMRDSHQVYMKHGSPFITSEIKIPGKFSVGQTEAIKLVPVCYLTLPLPYPLGLELYSSDVVYISP